MTDDDRKFLTKAMGECWHGVDPKNQLTCLCGVHFLKQRDFQFHILSINRTFDNRKDMMDLYQSIYEEGKWNGFSWWARIGHGITGGKNWRERNDAWLFCLSGEGYEERCQLVADFLRL